MIDLYLDKNKILDWFSITELNRLPKLNKLKFSKNPLLQSENEGSSRQEKIILYCLSISFLNLYRGIIIAKLKNLSELNRTKVTATERRGSEIDYLKIYGKLWKESGGHQDPVKSNVSKEFLKEHPRYQELINSKKNQISKN